ncbi:hypothetical protein G5714_021254 [Onychostoma macrolepis]|uniref:Uncharacterized protein n=1 Tax=Onychostoma macrolepis TaxID=369639 RepID=A0A7J6BQQ8_9TELE|nr:hypothetical protein G5714_021254 [Onychostoma macrolepis]
MNISRSSTQAANRSPADHPNTNTVDSQPSASQSRYFRNIQHMLTLLCSHLMDSGLSTFAVGFIGAVVGAGVVLLVVTVVHGVCYCKRTHAPVQQNENDDDNSSADPNSIALRRRTRN